jgi:biofilm PGA synthesis N-glycosyltransferase PgaC
MNSTVTVLIPAYNEAQHLERTIHSVQMQTHPANEIIVVDDCSTDDTGEIASKMGVTVLRPPQNTGSKARAQNYALPSVTTEYTVAIDADTALQKDALEEMVKAIDRPEISAACSFVLPGVVETIWERGRFIEYMFAFTFYKKIQETFGKPLICSGCFSIYRTDTLKAFGGWPTRTLAEDMDLTWSYYSNNKQVTYTDKAFCYPLEPHNLNFLSKQLKRWSHGFVQNVILHWNDWLHTPVLREQVLVGLADATITGILYLVFPLLFILLGNPLLMVYLYVSDWMFITLPVVWKGYKLKLLKKCLSSLPFYFILRIVNSIYFFQAIISELILNKSFTIYEKGH